MAESISICRHNKNGTGYCECLGEYCVEGLCTAEELIEYAPVRHGRWEYVKRRYEAWTHRCSECGEIMTTQIGRQANYCHNCGAKMDKEE